MSEANRGFTVMAQLKAPKGDDWMGAIQGALDVAGMIPVIGEVADGANALLYVAQGDYAMAALSAASMIPLVGNVTGAAKLGARYADDVIAVAARWGDEAAAAGKKGDEALDHLAARGGAPDFVVTRGGTAYPVPKGATGPVPVVNPAGKTTGRAFTGGKGGANGQVDTIRLMDPTSPKGASPGYPNGYIKYENANGQGVDPYTGKTGSSADTHFPID
jgi:hypothetical protein